MKITSLWEPEACTAGKMTYMTVGDDLLSFWVSQGVNMQTAQAKESQVPWLTHSLPRPFSTSRSLVM